MAEPEDTAIHLDLTARSLLRLTDEQRIARIDQDLWIGYSRARESLDLLEQIYRSERRIRPDNLLIVGATNNGKTAIARRFLSQHTLPEDPNSERATIPVAFILAPNGPLMSPLLSGILEALGRAPTRRNTVAQLRQETYRAMKDVGLRLLLIDDLHNVRGVGVGRMLVELRNIGSATGVSLGAFATKEIAYILRQDEQMANRFRLMTLPRWQFEDIEYAKLLATFEQRLPLWHKSKLTTPAIAQSIISAAGGLIGGITGILRDAAAEAIRTGHERIDLTILKRVKATAPERIEAVVQSSDF
jgi:hypothetical protein